MPSTKPDLSESRTYYYVQISTGDIEYMHAPIEEYANFIYNLTKEEFDVLDWELVKIVDGLIPLV